ncbi:class I SAM-dependent methyltransferase [Aquimarina sp. 2201CG5-10]|uniref:class I SAM-dependent methyltransferase n=1 Tax=Aquimarina callyspongiae TaxID=3098150 RepID=UPI002AB467D8|nr:class I SAM-dependent methyltransferase [Aquimarina sp. 2201CG5-10]MDY8135938.1 class I SAM-dependent methyltransferase [Aquimarina sp. 2201CG5-10]
MEKSIAIFEGERASNYDNFIQRWIPNYDYVIRILPNLLNVTNPKSILVVGCGTGNEMLALANSKNDWSITGIDPSPEMISIAKKKLLSLSNIQLIEARIEQLPKTEAYNAATLLLVLHFIPDDGSKLQLLKDIALRIEINASLVIIDIFGSKEDIIKNSHLLTSVLPDSIPKDEMEQRLDRIANQLYHITEERLSQLLIQAGFEATNRFYQMSIYGGWITKRIK